MMKTSSQTQAAQEDGNSGRVNAEISIHRVEGQDVTFECKFRISGSTKFFYKGGCENGNILIRTTDDTFQRGRYSMKYVKGTFIFDIMSVKITQLKTSDSGQYCCTIDKTWSPDYFELIVTEASNTLTPDFTLKPVPTTTFLLSASTTTQSLNFSSGGSTPSSASTGPAGSDFFLLLVVVSVVVLVLMFLVVLMLIYKKRTKGSVVLDRRRNSDHNQTETALYENLSPARTCEESVYQSLDAGSRDQDQTYSTLQHTK
ncbi:uncharacterized protein LOC115782617 isoform X2 [Archocentrus centrarchus]|uniref:uncharacterized protein LOC115782617 isoform X2 n=1 Tax=Archocentrus centrarchus TaxID=63155 RepID=UPI0011EA3F69|nr:uncharacterized protein LOC115782617 isoform X2 [Archocentrus centrarchus]